MGSNNKLFFAIFLFIITSCVSTNFDQYKSYNNLKNEKNFYEIIEPDNNENFVKVGVHTIFNRQNSNYIYITFKNKLSTDVDIESLNFGKIDKSPRDERVYMKEINGSNLKNDTIFLKFSDKIYKFYHD